MATLGRSHLTMHCFSTPHTSAITEIPHIAFGTTNTKESQRTDAEWIERLVAGEGEDRGNEVHHKPEAEDGKEEQRQEMRAGLLRRIVWHCKRQVATLNMARVGGCLNPQVIA